MTSRGFSISIAFALAVIACTRSKSNERTGPSIAIADQGPITLPAEFKSCAAAADCVIVADGCCSKVATNRAHAAATRDAIKNSKREYCAVKSACGAGPDGTDDGQPADCVAGACRTKGE